LRIRAIQEPVFSVANTDFEGGDDDHGYGDCIFLVIHAQPSHTPLLHINNNTLRTLHTPNHPTPTPSAKSNSIKRE
jgi:hypothetical protein